MDNHILYLSSADVENLNIDLNTLRKTVESSFESKSKKESWASDKSTIILGDAHIFQAKPGFLGTTQQAGMKWFGLVPKKADGKESINSVILLSDAKTGLLTAVVNANWITEKRTAAMSAIAAQKLARPDSASIGFLGAGVQAIGHLEALMLVLPQLRHVTVYSRTPQSAQRLCDAAQRWGLEAEIASDPETLVEQSDVVVSTIPEGAWSRKLLDPAHVRPGTFVCAVDLARTWDNTKLAEFDVLTTDDREQTLTLHNVGRMGFGGPYHADLADMCSGQFKGRQNANERTLFNFSGHALADLSVAALAVQASGPRGIGTLLPT